MHKWSPKINNVMVWTESIWKKCGSRISKFSLKIHFDQIFIIDTEKELFTLNLKQKIKGFYKEDVLILIVNDGSCLRKIKFQLATNATQCLQTLGSLFPIIKHGTNEQVKPFDFQYEKFHDVLKRILNDCLETTDSDVCPLSSSYKSFVKLCLLDPGFPNYVRETQSILEALK